MVSDSASRPSLTSLPPVSGRWQRWQLRNAAGSRNSTARARIVFTIIFTALAAWLGVELLSSPLSP